MCRRVVAFTASIGVVVECIHMAVVRGATPPPSTASVAVSTVSQVDRGTIMDLTLDRAGNIVYIANHAVYRVSSVNGTTARIAGADVSRMNCESVMPTLCAVWLHSPQYVCVR